MTRTVQGPVEFDGKKGVVLKDTTIVGGGLRLRNCPDPIIENVSVRSVKGHGIVLDNCPRSTLRQVTTHANGKINDKGNRVGHGLLVEGDCHGSVVYGLLSFDNLEDGVQHGNGATGLVTYVSAIIRDNNENAVDMKGGEAVFVLSYLSHTRRDEPILLHNNAKRVTFVRSTVHGHDEAPLVSVGNGSFHASATDFHKPLPVRWWKVDGKVHDMTWIDHGDLTFDRMCRLVST